MWFCHARVPLGGQIWGRFMGNARTKGIPARQDPLTAPERMLVMACISIVLEGVVVELPRASLLLALQAGLPHLRPDADFAVLAGAAARVLDAELQPSVLGVRVSDLRDALAAILARDLKCAMGEVQAMGLHHAA